jgi:hypothetical protein
MKGLVAVLMCASCGFTHGNAPGGDSGGGADATARKPPPQARVLGGAGRTASGTITIDVQVGEAVPVKKSTTNTFTISGAPVVQP